MGGWLPDSARFHNGVEVAQLERLDVLQPALTVPVHITVCVCTYKRPDYLNRLLRELGRQQTGGQFTFAIVVVDNDHLQSARAVVSAFAANSSVPVTYCVEPRQNIALARNKAVENASGDFVALIDDDELPTHDWLMTLFQACRKYDVDGVLGPVKPHYEEVPPQWVVQGKFYERRTYPTGFVIDWSMGRTGNVLLKKRLFEDSVQPFRPEFRTGEDKDFFRRMIEKGCVFVWCNDAIAYEVVPSIRWKRAFMLRRALLRGATSLRHPGFGARDAGKSLMAVPMYMILMVVALIFRRPNFMVVTVSLFDHLGRLLALLGVQPIREPYVTD